MFHQNYDKLILLFLLILFQTNLIGQDFYQTYKTEFLEPYQKIKATPEKEDDRLFFQDQIKSLNTYQPQSLQRYIAKEIVALAESDVETQKESIDAGLILLRKNWLRGKEKIDLLKKIEKTAENLQGEIKYDKKKEKLELYAITYQIELEIIEEYLSLLKYEDAKTYLFKWERTADNVRDQNISNSLELNTLRLKSKIHNYKELSQSIVNYKGANSSPTYKKTLAFKCLIHLNSPESALSFLEGTNLTEEINSITAFSKFLNKQNNTAKAPYYFSNRDLMLPPPILFERLSRIKELSESALFAKEKFEEGNYQYFHHARDMTREMTTKFPDDPTYDETSLVRFFNWIDSILKSESEEAQLFYLYQLKTIMEEAKTEIKDPQNLISFNKIESSYLDRISKLEKFFKLTKVRFPVPELEPENEKEKQWNAKSQNEQRLIIESMYEKLRKENPNPKRLSFQIDGHSLTLNINHDTQMENLSPLKEIPFKVVNMVNTNSIVDFSFLKDSPVVTINANNSGIKSLTWLKNMKSLRNLNISRIRGIYDLSDLKGLNITSLNVSYTSIKDLSPLKQMPLLDLNIEGTGVTTLLPLEFMPLTNLNANHCNSLKDIDSLANTNLRILRLNGCELVTSLEGLSKLRLRELYIEETNVSDLTPITKSMLSHFYFSKCPKIRSVGEISMMNIEYLGINHLIPISTIIKYEFPLKHLKLTKTGIQDLTPLNFFQQLNSLDISECDNIRDLKTLKNPAVTNLIAHQCKSLKTFKGISETNVKNLYANYLDIKELSSLIDSKVEKLEMKNSELLTLKGVAQFPLKDLDVRDSRRLKEATDLKDTLVEMLWLSGTAIKSFDFTRDIRSLKFCDSK